MKTLIFNNLQEMEPYYNKNTNTYEFMKDGGRLNIELKFNFNVDANIKAGDIKAEDIKAEDINAWDINAGDINAWDINAMGINAGDINAWDINAGDIKAEAIKAMDIKAWDIKAWNIKARNIDYFAVCFAHESITCKTINGRREKSKHFCLDGEIVIKPKKSEKDLAIEKAEQKLKEAQTELEKAKAL